MPDDAEKLLGRQIGPLPAGGWVVALFGGGIIAYYIWKRQKSSSAAAAAAGASQTTPSSSTQGVPGATGDLGSGALGLGSVLSLPNGVAFQSGFAPSLQPSSPFTTDAQWSTAATSQLIQAGYDALTVNKALSDYINGNTMTAQEQQILDVALKAVGPPPIPPTPSNQSLPFIPPQGETNLINGNPSAGFWYGPNGPNVGQGQNYQDAQGNTYSWIQNPVAAGNLLAAGIPLYFQPSPGTFAPYTAGENLGPSGAALFVRNSSPSGVGVIPGTS